MFASDQPIIKPLKGSHRHCNVSLRQRQDDNSDLVMYDDMGGSYSTAYFKSTTPITIIPMKNGFILISEEGISTDNETWSLIVIESDQGMTNYQGAMLSYIEKIPLSSITEGYSLEDGTYGLSDGQSIITLVTVDWLTGTGSAHTTSL